MHPHAGANTKTADASDERAWLGDVSASLDIGFFVVNKDLTYAYFNERAREYFDLPEGFDFRTANVESFVAYFAERGDFGPVDVESFTQEYLQTVKKLTTGETNVKLPKSIITKNGRSLEIFRIPRSDGSIIVTVKDVSQERKKSEALEIALELGKAGYWTYSVDNRKFILSSNYLWSIFTPEERESLSKHTLMPFVHPDDVDDAQAYWDQISKQTKPQQKTMRFVTENHGVLNFRFHARPQFTNTGRQSGIICFFEDVTDSLVLEDELRQAKDQAEKTLQAQNNFLARLSHEIRTPMNAVIGLTDALVEQSVDTKVKPKLKLIQSSADNIMNILEGTLNHTRLDADKLMLDPKPGNPRETVETICRLWETQAKKNGTTIRCHIDKKTPDEVEFDRFRYEQCLNNLLSNAVKFTPQGRVDVILTLVGEDSINPRLVLAVKDTGIGMTPAQQERIFDAYTQADKSISSRFGGTGLGMNITKKIIEMMGGTISVRSVIGDGTVFALALPVQLEKESNENLEDNLVDQLLAEVPEEKGAPDYSNLKILVADDNPTNHMVIESLLENVVGTLYKAENGQEVLNILEVKDIDIVLMDIHMPIMDGIEATLAIRKSNKHWSDILIIAVTADPQYQQMRLCKNIGMDDSLAKPVKLAGLLEGFDRVLQLDRNKAPHKEMYKTAV